MNPIIISDISDIEALSDEETILDVEFLNEQVFLLFSFNPFFVKE
jgi:hypothetical protein